MTSYDKTISWVTASGKPASVRISLQVRETLWADGDECKVKCCKLATLASVPGMNTMHYPISRRSQRVAGTTYPATIGRLVIPASQLAEIDAALAEVYAMPEWQAKQRGEAAAKKAGREYDRHAAEMHRRMYVDF